MLNNNSLYFIYHKWLTTATTSAMFYIAYVSRKRFVGLYTVSLNQSKLKYTVDDQLRFRGPYANTPLIVHFANLTDKALPLSLLFYNNEIHSYDFLQIIDYSWLFVVLT